MRLKIKNIRKIRYLRQLECKFDYPFDYLFKVANRWKTKMLKNLVKSRLSSIPEKHETGDERIELPPKVLETPIIPFDQSPK